MTRRSTFETQMQSREIRGVDLASPHTDALHVPNDVSREGTRPRFRQITTDDR
jgi:hypothetical protein